MVIVDREFLIASVLRKPSAAFPPLTWATTPLICRGTNNQRLRTPTEELENSKPLLIAFGATRSTQAKSREATGKN